MEQEGIMTTAIVAVASLAIGAVTGFMVGYCIGREK